MFDGWNNRAQTSWWLLQLSAVMVQWDTSVSPLSLPPSKGKTINQHKNIWDVFLGVGFVREIPKQ